MDTEPLIVAHLIRNKPYSFTPIDLMCLPDSLLLAKEGLLDTLSIASAGAIPYVPTSQVQANAQQVAAEMQQAYKTTPGDDQAIAQADKIPLSTVGQIKLKKAFLGQGFKMTILLVDGTEYKLATKGRLTSMNAKQFFPKLQALYPDKVQIV